MQSVWVETGESASWVWQQRLRWWPQQHYAVGWRSVAGLQQPGAGPGPGPAEVITAAGLVSKSAKIRTNKGRIEEMGPMMEANCFEIGNSSGIKSSLLILTLLTCS